METKRSRNLVTYKTTHRTQAFHKMHRQSGKRWEGPINDDYKSDMDRQMIINIQRNFWIGHCIKVNKFALKIARSDSEPCNI